jgi:hypothetical protein
MIDEDKMIQSRLIADHWFKPINWPTYQPDQYPALPLAIIFVDTYAYLRLMSTERQRYHFELYDFAQSDRPLNQFSVPDLRGLREASDEEVAASAAWIAKKMIEDSLRRVSHDPFNR